MAEYGGQLSQIYGADAAFTCQAAFLPGDFPSLFSPPL